MNDIPSHRPDPLVSVIIPCYNQGQYLGESVASVLQQTYRNFEIVIVDDGSTDEHTVRILDDYRTAGTKLIRTKNQGLASARNAGIDQSAGKYILPLDADDKIGHAYLEKAARILETNHNVGIVYCKAELFGDVSGEWNLPAYHFPEILHGNMIFCSGLFRKSDWSMVNGYDPEMRFGWEDYDFWLSLIELGREVVCLPETLFIYRRYSGSMIHGMTRDQQILSYNRLFKKHCRLYQENIGTLLLSLNELANLKRQHEGQIASLEAAVRRLEYSRSWRLTEPLRHVSAILRVLVGRRRSL